MSAFSWMTRRSAAISCRMMSQKTQRSLAAIVPLGAVDLFAHEVGHDRQRDELRVRVLERRAGRRAVVLEDQDVAEAPILLQIEDALAEGPQHPLDLGLRHRRQRLRVVGRSR